MQFSFTRKEQELWKKQDLFIKGMYALLLNVLCQTQCIIIMHIHTEKWQF